MYVFIDESQDNERLVLSGIGVPDLIVPQSIVGKWRTIARRFQLRDVHEFHEAHLYRNHPRMLTRALHVPAYGERKNRRPHPRQDLRIVSSYYLKTPSEQTTSSLVKTRLIPVYQDLFQALVWALPWTPQEDLDVICDQFEGCENVWHPLPAIITSRVPAGTVRFEDSVAMKPLQVADLVAGTTRRHLGGDPNEGRFSYLALLLHHLGVVPIRP